MKRHCWKDKATYMAEKHGTNSNEWVAAYANPCTCMLPYNHDGPHEWTSDEEIHVIPVDILAYPDNAS